MSLFACKEEKVAVFSRYRSFTCRRSVTRVQDDVSLFQAGKGQVIVFGSAMLIRAERAQKTSTSS